MVQPKRNGTEQQARPMSGQISGSDEWAEIIMADSAWNQQGKRRKARSTNGQQNFHHLRRDTRIRNPPGTRRQRQISRGNQQQAA